MTRLQARTLFLVLTGLGITVPTGFELVYAFDGNPNTEPWTQLITTYVPWQIALAIFGAIVGAALAWIPAHFYVAYRKRK